MNRRNFLKAVTGVLAAAVVAKAAPVDTETTPLPLPGSPSIVGARVYYTNQFKTGEYNYRGLGYAIK